MGTDWCIHGCVCLGVCVVYIYRYCLLGDTFIVQELCESRGGHPGLSVLMSLLVSVDVKNY